MNSFLLENVYPSNIIHKVVGFYLRKNIKIKLASLLVFSETHYTPLGVQSPTVEAYLGT